MNNTLTLKHIPIMFKNFRGAADEFNAEGNRNFAAVIEDPTMAEALREEGWNIKEFTPKDSEDIIYYLPVKVSYKVMAPEIVAFAGKVKTVYTEDIVGLLDGASIKEASLTVTAYHWNMGKKSGVSAYLKKMLLVLEVDELDEMLAEMEAPEEPVGIPNLPDDDDLPFDT